MVHFREAVAEDASLISHIYAASWRGSYQALIPAHYLERLPDDYWVPSIRSWLGSGRLNGLILYEEHEPLGCVIYGRGRDEDHDSWGEIVSIYFLPHHTRQGFGGQLLEEALSRMRSEGYSRFYLWALEGNQPADAFYRKHGFFVTTDRVRYQIGGANVTDLRYVRVEHRQQADGCPHKL